MQFSVGIIGQGYWGPKLLRNFSVHHGFHVRWVCDRNEHKRREAGANYPTVRLTADVEEVLTDAATDVIVIATQASTHYSLCRSALLNGKHVFIEKPFVLSAAEAEELCQLSGQTNRKIFVDHTFLFCAAFQKLRQMLTDGEMGRIFRISSRRCDFGPFPNDANVVWHLMYHDAYLLLALFGAPPVKVSCQGSAAIHPGIADGACALLDFTGGAHANILCDMYWPAKQRDFTVQCEQGILVWDETQPSPLSIIDYRASLDASGKIQYVGDRSIKAILLEQHEPLQAAMVAFHDYLMGKSEAPCNGQSALATVSLIESLDERLKQ